MIIKNDKIILRDLIKADINDRIRWEKEETEWQHWDAPWEDDTFDTHAYTKKSLKRIEYLKHNNNVRNNFQICINNAEQTHIGWCNVYNIDANHKYTKEDGFKTIGINIPEPSARRKGYATAAWTLLINYLHAQGIKDIYTQTWSGNIRVLGLIEKIGFQEWVRIKNARNVHGKHYDALTFKLNLDTFLQNYKH